MSRADQHITPSAFTEVAAYYDHLMSTVPYGMWVAYYLLLLSQQDVHPKTILDVCCGTGTMCEMLDEEGFEMYGIDVSPGMIEQAKEKARKNNLPINYWCMDASSFELNTAYAFEQHMFDQQNLRPGAELRYKGSGEWDAESRLITVRMKFWHEGREFEEVHVQRAYEEAAIREMLRIAGFTEIHAYHSYSLDPPR